MISLVQDVGGDHRGIEAKVSHGWWERVCQHHLSLTLRAAANLGSSFECISAHFDEVALIFCKNELADCPGQIFNMDESGMLKSTKVIAKKGAKDLSYISSGNKSHITVVGCVSATGISIPPMILFLSGKLCMLIWLEEKFLVLTMD